MKKEISDKDFLGWLGRQEDALTQEQAVVHCGNEHHISKAVLDFQVDRLIREEYLEEVTEDDITVIVLTGKANLLLAELRDPIDTNLLLYVQFHEGLSRDRAASAFALEFGEDPQLVSEHLNALIRKRFIKDDGILSFRKNTKTIVG